VSILPQVSGRKVVKALQKIGYEKNRQKGSHIVLRHKSPPHRRITIPDHKNISSGTLRAIIRHTGLTVEGFIKLL